MKPLDPRLLRHARAARRHLVACVVLGIVTAGLVLVQAELLSGAVARVVERSVGSRAVAAALAGLAAVVAGRALVAWAAEVTSQRSSAAVKSELRRRMVAHATRTGPSSEGARSRAEVAALALEGLDALDGYFSRYLPQLALAAIIPVVVIARLAVADPTSAVIVVLTLPLIPVFMWLIGVATQAATARRWDALGRLSHHFLDVVSGLPTLKVFGRAKAQAASVRRTTDEYRATTMATLRIAFLSSLVLELLATLSVALVAVSVGLRMVDGRLDLPTGLLVIILAPEAYLPLREVGVRFHAAADGVAAAERVFAVLETPVVAGGHETDVPDLRAGGRLTVRGACVAHPGRRGFAPDGVDLDVAPGELVVLTGPSGAGKTSLLGAVLGSVPLAAGSITVAGGGRSVPLEGLDTDAWRETLAWVDQAPYLFAGTVADNVRLAAPDAHDEAVRCALDGAGLERMPADRRVGQGGQGLSAGERRRVAVARAVLRDAPLVLLDEPTAGLDVASEATVLDAIRRLARHRAVLVVSHRPAVIAAADRVVAVTATPAGPTDGGPGPAATGAAGSGADGVDRLVSEPDGDPAREPVGAATGEVDR